MRIHYEICTNCDVYIQYLHLFSFNHYRFFFSVTNSQYTYMNTHTRRAWNEHHLFIHKKYLVKKIGTCNYISDSVLVTITTLLHIINYTLQWQYRVFFLRYLCCYDVRTLRFQKLTNFTQSRSIIAGDLVILAHLNFVRVLAWTTLLC